MQAAHPVTPTLPPAERVASPFLLVYAALGVAAGVWAADRAQAAGWLFCRGEQLAPNPARLLAPLALLLLAGILGRSRRRILVPVLMAAMALAGAWWCLGHPLAPCWGPGDLAFYNGDANAGRPAVIEGVVSGYPDLRPTASRYQVKVDTLWQGEERLPVTGTILLRAGADEQYKYGDRLRIRGALATPNVYPDFDYRRYLAQQGIYTIVQRPQITWLAGGQGQPLWSALYTLRAGASAVLYDLLPEPYAALANGMILGIDSGIPADLDADFKATGTSHVLVISGMNIAVLSAFLLVVCRWLARGRKGPATLATLICIVLYTLLVGAGPSVVRAAVMGGIAVIGLALGRPSAALISLFLAGLVMLVLNPKSLWDVGFQLSFMATLGLVLFAGPLQQRWQSGVGARLPRRVSGVVAEGLLLTLAAQATTLPLIILYFGRLSLISFVANALVVPVQSPILLAGIPAIGVGFFSLPLGRIIALVPGVCLWWTTAIVQRLAALPYASVEVGALGRTIAAVYLALFGAGFLWWLFRQEQQAATWLPAGWAVPARWGVAAAVLVTLPVWIGATIGEGQPDGRLHLYLLGREQAAAFLLVTPGGARVLLDPVRSAPAYPLAGVVDEVPGPRTLDLVIRTRPASSAPGPPFAPTILEAKDPALQPGASLNLDGGVTLSVLHAPAGDDDSLLFQLRYRDFSTLLPFENSQQVQTVLAGQAPAPLTVLPAPYPGTGAWPHPDLLARLRPAATLVPVGATYPPASSEALAALSNPVFIPADAIVELVSDGSTFALQTRSYAADLRGGGE